MQVSIPLEGIVIKFILHLPAISSLWLSLGAAVLSISFTALLIRIATARGWVVIPSHNRWNKRVVAQFGGAAMLLAFWIVTLAVPGVREYTLLLLAVAGMALLGLIDDIRGLGPKPKLAAEFLFAGLVIYGGIVYPLTAHIVFNRLFTLFWIVAITNAFNLIDNMDGFAAGVAVISLGTIALLVGANGTMGTLCLVLMASVAGFLLFNFNPAKIFMGDLGALPIGFFLASASTLAAKHTSLTGAALLPCLILLVPIFDIFLVSITRRIQNRAISEGARDHSSHRLVFLGLSERRSVSILHGMAFLAGMQALLWTKFPVRWMGSLVVLFFLGVLHFWLYMAKLEIPEDWLSRIFVPRLPRFLQHSGAKVMSAFLDAALSALGLYFIYIFQFGGRNLQQFAVIIAISCIAKIASFAFLGSYQSTHRSSFIFEAQQLLKGMALSACFILPFWMVVGLPLASASLLALEDTFLTGTLLLLGRSSGNLFCWFFDKRTSLGMDNASANRMALQLGSNAKEFGFSHLSSHKELMDELES